MSTERYRLAFKLYPYERSPDQDRDEPAHWPVVIIGGGPIGVATALDLGKKGVRCLVLDDHEGVGAGSRAICFSKRTLEIADRLGCGDPMVEKGVVWNSGKVFYGDRRVYQFNLLPEDGHRRPAFINLQQPYFEQFLVERLWADQAEGAQVEIRGKNRVDAIDARDDYVALEVATPEGAYKIHADWVVACDGAGSSTRKMMGLDFEGRVFEDNFLIADVKMKADFPTERWFWFDPPFKSGASALLHKQPDDVWRIDFQLGWNIDRQAELQEDCVRARVAEMLGADVEYELVWTSIYTFQCRRMKTFRRGRVLFAGDAAHQVSPFGARGANSGMQDAENLAWKLDLVLKGVASANLLDSYDWERIAAADENILNSTRSTDFITPKSEVSRVFRDAVLDLSEHFAFARPLVNSGRLSTPAIYDGSPLNTPDALDGPTRTRPGAPASDAPQPDGWLLDRLGNQFQVLTFGCAAPEPLVSAGAPVTPLEVAVNDHVRERYLGDASAAVYLMRPDQHIAGRWANFDRVAVDAAVKRALGG